MMKQDDYMPYTKEECEAMAKTIEQLRREKKELIEKTVDWLQSNWRNYAYQDADNIFHFGHWENDYRKAMEE